MKNGPVLSFLLFLTYITPALGFLSIKLEIIQYMDRTNLLHQRITEWFGLEGTLKISNSNTLAVGRDTSH